MTDRELFTRAALVLAVAALFIALVTGAHAQALDAPDDTLTPGDIRTGALHAARPHTPAAVIAEAERLYHVGPHDRVAEWDHRIPWGCLGASTVKNLWPQSSPAKIRKDRLEHWFERQVTLGRMTVEDCQEAFKAPNRWEDRYRVVFGEDP